MCFRLQMSRESTKFHPLSIFVHWDSESFQPLDRNLDDGMRNTFSQKLKNICTHSLEKYKTSFLEISTLFHTEYPISLNNKPENVKVIWIQQQEILPYGTGGIVFAELVLNPWFTSLGPPHHNFSNAGPLLCVPDRQQGQQLRHPGG